MISFYKKVFLALLRFSFHEALIGGILTGGASLIGNLFGGSKGSSNLDMATNAQRNLRESQDVAGGSGDPSSAPSFKGMADEAGKKIGELGNKFAGQFVEELSSRFIRNKADQWFGDKPISPTQRGLSQRQYNQAAYPGVNPWEIAGGGGAASSAGGGTAVAEQQRASKREVANITTAPAIKRAEIEYQTLHPKVKLLEQTARTGGATQKQIESKTVQDTALEPYADKLASDASALRFHERQIKGSESYIKGKESDIIDQSVKQSLQKTAQSVLKTAIDEEELTLKKATANMIRVLAENPSFGAVAGVLAAVLGAIAAIGGKSLFKRKGVTSAPSFRSKKKVGNPQSGKEWREWQSNVRKQMKNTAKKYVK